MALVVRMIMGADSEGRLFYVTQVFLDLNFLTTDKEVSFFKSLFKM